MPYPNPMFDPIRRNFKCPLLLSNSNFGCLLPNFTPIKVAETL
jgi:hypothetical protein